jgi:hypothetical protein
MIYSLVKPHDDYSLLGTTVVLDSGHWYVSTPATNQPDSDNKIFIIYSASGDWEVDEDEIDHCMGFLLTLDEVEEDEDEEPTDDIEEIIDRLYEKNCPQDHI